MEVLKLIVPGLVAAVGSAVFYWRVKSKIDKSIEAHKVSYAGVFKERIEIYKKLLEEIFEIEDTLSLRMNTMSRDDVNSITEKINAFIRFCWINQPFLSVSLFDKIENLRKEYVECFKDSHIGGEKRKQKITMTEGIEQQMKSLNKLKGDHFKLIRNEIITQMRKDLQTDEKKNKAVL